jgi:protoporphyrinogen oxidase
MIVILGAGLAGISVAYHLRRKKYVLYEKETHPGGHIRSELLNGYTWDEGPHISFTKNEYVQDLFKDSVDNDYCELEAKISNYFQGHWIPHPAQTNLFAAPDEIKNKCIDDFLLMRKSPDYTPNNYQEWLERAFGKTFAKIFPEAYTRKYWTTEAKNLTTDWIGTRVHFPNIDDVVNGGKGPLNKSTNYISTFRYPSHGGYFSFAKKMSRQISLKENLALDRISFKNKKITLSNGETIQYDKLVSTIPLPTLILNSDAPEEIKESARSLNCTSLLLLNFSVRHEATKEENWMYIYDENKFSTRINYTEKLSPHNAPVGKSGIQVEVYFSSYRPFQYGQESYKEKVLNELIEMGLIKSPEYIDDIHTKWVEWANVIFDNRKQDALNGIFNWMEQFGLYREADEQCPMTDWTNKFAQTKKTTSSIFLAGRFGQWKYYWTDDCVLRGKFLSEII